MLVDLWKNMEHKNDCYAHEFKHCGILIKFPWKVKVTYENKVWGGDGSYHAACSSRHLEMHCDEAGRN